MAANAAMQLEKPRIENHRAFLIGGFQESFPEPPKGAPELWRRFVPHLGKIPGQAGPVAYGVASSISEQGACTYTAGVEVSDFPKLSAEFARLTIPANRHAVFSHHAHVDKLADTIDQILKKWLPASGLALENRPAGTPVFFERYGERFNPKEGKGDVEVWVPIRA
ncbi:MAG: GyrI-like domain-containing protein [Candidatus Acidiferrum sp.]